MARPLRLTFTPHPGVSLGDVITVGLVCVAGDEWGPQTEGVCSQWKRPYGSQALKRWEPTSHQSQHHRFSSNQPRGNAILPRGTQIVSHDFTPEWAASDINNAKPKRDVTDTYDFTPEWAVSDTSHQAIAATSKSSKKESKRASYDFLPRRSANDTHRTPRSNDPVPLVPRLKPKFAPAFFESNVHHVPENAAARQNYTPQVTYDRAVDQLSRPGPQPERRRRKPKQPTSAEDVADSTTQPRPTHQAKDAWLRSFEFVEVPDFFQVTKDMTAQRVVEILARPFYCVSRKEHRPICQYLFDAIAMSGTEYVTSAALSQIISNATQMIHGIIPIGPKGLSSGIWKSRPTFRLSDEQLNLLSFLEPALTWLNKSDGDFDRQATETSLRLIRAHRLRHHLLTRLSSALVLGDRARAYSNLFFGACSEDCLGAFELGAFSCIRSLVVHEPFEEVAARFIKTFENWNMSSDSTMFNMCLVFAVDILGKHKPGCPIQWDDLKILFRGGVKYPVYTRQVQRLVAELLPWLRECVAISPNKAQPSRHRSKKGARHKGSVA
eukprot:Blabericola_migrator_1__2995@NODE_1869_length_3623_cov_21_772216_g1196_i0_p1_GENE_NODE_1869_length_3623_cov_21_772216_g1196_i0NODE_1869_length_3623_cov_21_772216_g1196_i0_p1_ORF_typecomplete_len551_score58_03_NODE_1869_length_3623_cov_21_772216_g1196_i0411693